MSISLDISLFYLYNLSYLQYNIYISIILRKVMSKITTEEALEYHINGKIGIGVTKLFLLLEYSHPK